MAAPKSVLALLLSSVAGLRMSTKRGPTVHTAPSLGAEFRGAFRDLSVWVDPVQSSTDTHLWVVEYMSAEQLSAERLRAESAGLEVVLQEKKSLLMQGNVPGLLGYDACGGEPNKTVISVASRAVSYVPMPSADASKYLALARNADPWIVALLDQVSQSSITDSITTLQSYTSRNSASGSSGLGPAAEWASAQFTSYGFQVTRDSFRSDYTSQIIAELPGVEEPDKIVVLGAHLDSTAGWGSSPSTRSPGADDNGSGSASVLEFARLISSNGARFKHTLRLCLFTGEEQGLVGSRALAGRWSDQGVNVIAMVNVDMLGYRRSGDPITIPLMTGAADAAFTNIARATAETYLPEYDHASTSACCSDQQSFHENGYPAASFFETPGSGVVYPQYHSTTDLLQYIDPLQISVQASAAIATVSVMAELLPLAPTPAPLPTPPTQAPTPAPTPAPVPTPTAPSPPSPPTPPSTGDCVHQKDCAVSPWCTNIGFEEWCRGQGASCPAPMCTRA